MTRSTITIRVSRKLATKLEKVAKEKNKSVTAILPSDIGLDEQYFKSGYRGNRQNRKDYFEKLMDKKLERNVIQ